MVFQTKLNHKSTPPEKNTGPSFIEKAGYIPAKARIENMILAGQRLVAFRKEQFDMSHDKIDEDFDDPTRSKNYDLADAFQDSLAVNARFTESYEKAQEASDELSNTKSTNSNTKVDENNVE